MAKSGRRGSASDARPRGRADKGAAPGRSTGAAAGSAGARGDGGGAQGGSSRAFVVLGLFLLLAAIVVLRLLYLQVIKADEYSQMAQQERTVDITIEPRRGTIYDRNGNVLAISVDATTIYANPSEITMPEYTAFEISKVLGGETADYADVIKNSVSKTFVYIKRKADVDQAEQLKALGLEGVYFIDDTRREYPYGQTAGQVVGFCNIDGVGMSGLELFYNDVLKGQAGRLVAERASDGTPIPGGVHEDSPSIDGMDIMVSIDVELQDRVEKSLLQYEEGLMANGGTALVLDGSTGEIFAAASLPLFNPADPGDSKAGSDALACVTAALEPGSVFKTIAAMSVLESKTMGPEDVIECPAELEVDGYIVSDAHERGDTEYSLRDIIKYSSNVGISLAVEQMGFADFYDDILKFRMNEQTGVDYPGEAFGYLLDFGKWSRVQGYNASFGQGLSITPVQMASFYGALLNDGVQCTPHFLISKLTSGERVKWATHTLIEDKQAMSDMRSMLLSVVESGTGTEAGIAGYDAAGKTSTAEIASEEGGYLEDEYNVAFVGYIENSNSKLVCYVGANRTPWTSTTTPVFRDIMTYVVDKYRISPE